MNSTTPAVVVPAPSQGPTLIIVGTTFLVINVFAIGLRVYTKVSVSKNFGYNDIGMMTVLLTYASLLALLIIGVQNGIGDHTFKATIPKLAEALKVIWFLEVIYVTLTSIMKASIATTLRQWAVKKVHIWLLWGSIVVDVAITLAFTLYLILQCQPVSYAWRLFDPTVKGKCLPFTGQLYMGYALSITTVGLDMLFLFLPFAMLRGRGVSTRIKVYIYAIFGLGVLASFANFVRLAALVKLKSSNDQLFTAGPVFLWSAVEVSIGIFVAGILELRPLLGKYRVKGFENYGPSGKFFKMDENGRGVDGDMVRLQSLDKSTIKVGMKNQF